MQFAAKLHQGNQQVHIVQIGDSHTAADFFTGELRHLFQQHYGDAGPGFVPPIAIPGQRTATLNRLSDKSDWLLSSSRKDKRANYPLGGLIAQPKSDKSRILLKPLHTSQKGYYLQALYQSTTGSLMQVSSSSRQSLALPATGNRWQLSPPVSTQLPSTISVDSAHHLNLGGWVIRSNKPGVMLSAIGLNGATLNMLDKWQSQWSATLAQMSPDMVILAFGTNEAFNDTLDLAAYAQNLQDKIQQIRKQSAHAVIMLVGPSDSIKFNHATSCRAQMPVNLMNVIQIQKHIAAQEHALFWDWQANMGGPCAIRNWQSHGLASADNVHLSANGYKKSAQALYRQLSQMLN